MSVSLNPRACSVALLQGPFLSHADPLAHVRPVKASPAGHLPSSVPPDLGPSPRRLATPP